MLIERLSGDLKDALKNKDQVRLGVLRSLMSEIKNTEIDSKQAGKEMSDDDVSKVIQGEAKKRRESIAMFKDGGRSDLVEEEQAQLDIILSYLPKELSREEIVDLANRFKEEATTFPELMKAVMAESKGRADGRIVSEVVKEVLNG